MDGHEVPAKNLWNNQMYHDGSDDVAKNHMLTATLRLSEIFLFLQKNSNIQMLNLWYIYLHLASKLPFYVGKIDKKHSGNLT